MKWINTLIEKILKIDYKLKIKNFLDKMKINEVLIISIILAMPVTIIGMITKNIILSTIFILLFIIILIFAILLMIRSVIDDIDKIAKLLLLFALITFIITFITVILSKFAYWIVPLYHSDPQNDKVYDLVFNTYTSIIAAGIGIVGTYFGAVYGGKKAIEATKIQLDQQAKDNKDQMDENRKFSLKIISKLLYKEIKNNYTCYLNYYLIGPVNLDLDYKKLKDGLQFEIYDNTKYELIKYSDGNSLVEDVIDVYNLFRIFTRHNFYHELNFYEKKELNELNNKVQKLIANIDSIDNVINIKK